ncbi:MAG: chemotaxis protein CheW, partial [Bdellovibrionota bacterium]
LVSTNLDLQKISSAIGLPEAALREVHVAAPVENIEAETLLSTTLDEVGELEAPVDRESSSIRVEIRKLDEVLERLSELIVTRSKLTNIVTKLAAAGVDTRELNATVAENGRQLKRLRTAITQARMVSLSELLQRLPLVVRGLTRDPAKSVDIFVQAGSAEVDKAVADKIFPAIVHLIRNSVDHAIETKSERNEAGKDETGVITVHCDDSSGTTLSITIKDDGRGIDREAVARKAGLPVAKTDEELLKQICMPGLSTRESVSLTSGRGMGMDIVKKIIEMLGGGLTLSTRVGAGTTFKLRVPVSITIVDVLSFVSGGQIFVAPVAMIDEIVEVNPENLPQAPSLTNSGPRARLLNRRGETIPFLVLESVLNGRPDGKIPTRALVVNQLSGAVAFGVDRMLGQQEVVIRPRDESLVRARGMNGAADLGDGNPTLVLDLASLGAEFAMSSEVSL